MFSFTTIPQFHNQLTAGTGTCTAAVKHYLAEIEKNNHLNAFVEVFSDGALEKAAYLDKERATGKPLKKLHGVVIAIKDVICYKGHQISAASNVLQNFTSLYTATALQYLLDEDAIIIGRCNCDEFAMGSTNENSAYGAVKNAIDETRVPGGSSGGSAVAVQAGMCMFSLGSDTGGSVRQPADFCGITGFKPGYGSISRYGLIAYASSFDQIGIFGNDIADISLLWQIMSKPDEKDSTMQQHVETDAIQIPKKKDFKIGIFTQAMKHDGLDKEIAKSFTDTIEQLKDNGLQVDELELELFDYIVPAYYVLTTAEASSNLSRYDGVRFGNRGTHEEDLENFYKENRSTGFGLEVKRRIMLGSFVLSTGYYDAYFAKAQQIRSMLIEKMNDIWANYDAILMPVSPATAFKIGEQKDPVSTYLADIYTVLANLTGVPAIALPLFSHSNGMPYGLQVMTKKTDELTLFEIAAMLNQVKHTSKQPK